MAKNDGEEGKERRVGRTYKSSDVHRRTSNFKAIRGSKQPARETARETVEEPEAAPPRREPDRRTSRAALRGSASGGTSPAETSALSRGGQDYLTPLRMSDEEIDAALRPAARSRWDERAGRYRDDAQPERGRAIRPEDIPSVQPGEEAAAQPEVQQPTQPDAEAVPAAEGETAPELTDQAGRAARTPYARRANDAFAQSGRRFDAENAPEVEPLDAEDFEEGDWDGSAAPAGAAHARVRRVKTADKPKRHVGRIIAIIITVLLLIALAIFGIFSWNRWLRYDDVADFQGQWYADGTSTPVTIEADTIRLTPDVAYLYELDTMSKTLTFSFGKLEGHARYWFEDDRARLVIVDGEGYTAVNTFIEDFERTVAGLVARTGGSALQLPEGQDVIVLSRTPTVSPAQPASASSAAASPADGSQEPSAASPEASIAAADPGQESAASASASASAASASSGQASEDSSAKSRQMLTVSDILAELPSADDSAAEG